jgi:hypothetical protein
MEIAQRKFLFRQALKYFQSPGFVMLHLQALLQVQHGRFLQLFHQLVTSLLQAAAAVLLDMQAAVVVAE